MSFGDRTIWNAEEGRFLSGKANRVAQALAEYNPELRLAWIPPEHREVGDVPYAVIHDDPRHGTYVAFHVEEDQLESALARVMMGDITKNPNLLNEIEAAEAAARTLVAKRHQEELDEQHEIATSIFRSKLHAYKHGGKVYQ